jgi:enoyl-CoA hydratase
MSLVRLESGEHPGVRVLTLDDPDRRNAIGSRMQDELAGAVAAVAADPGARALVVTGAGTAFCAGADLPAVFGGPARPVAEVRRQLSVLYDSFLAVRRLAIPTLAAVHGAAVGAGANLALCCDLRIAGPGASFGFTFARLGLHPGGGASYFLVRALGAQRALATLLDGAVLDAAQALACGLVLSVQDDPLEHAREAATRYAQLDPDLARDIKHATRIAETSDLDAVLDFESWAQASSAGSPQVRAAVDRLARGH